MIKLVHTADWQLGKPFGRFPPETAAALSEARLDVIDRIAEIAAERGARHVLVAGDVFDNVEPGDRIFGQAMARMGRASATWWLLPGNHDHARPGGLWDRLRARASANVRIVDVAEAVELEEGAWLLPAPLEHRKTTVDPTAAMVDMGTPPGALRIGLAHGSITEFGATGESANLIPPDRARTARLDYLALGDWHGFMKVGDRTAYSGTPEVDRFGRDEPGAVAVVEVNAGEVPVIERIETGRHRWLKATWEIAEPADLTRRIDALRADTRLEHVLLDVTLAGVASLSDRVAMLDALEQLRHELRHLDVDDSQLLARPTAEDIARIDVQGTLATVAETLRAQSEASANGSDLAAAALERLYVEVMRQEAETPA